MNGSLCKAEVCESVPGMEKKLTENYYIHQVGVVGVTAHHHVEMKICSHV